jgi:hypothetical protein
MKNIWFISLFILSIVLMGCSETNKDNEELSQTNTGMVEKSGTKMNQTQKQKKETGMVYTDAVFEQKVQNGEIIMISKEGESESFDFNNETKIKAMKLPDGNLHQVREDGDRTYINVPGEGEMGIIMLNDKFYLFDDDDQAYELKFANNKLFAEKTELTDVVLSRK